MCQYLQEVLHKELSWSNAEYHVTEPSGFKAIKSVWLYYKAILIIYFLLICSQDFSKDSL